MRGKYTFSLGEVVYAKASLVERYAFSDVCMLERINVKISFLKVFNKYADDLIESLIIIITFCLFLGSSELGIFLVFGR